MKIYCRTRERNNPLDRFIGKDAWVLCKLRKKDGELSRKNFWVRIFKEIDNQYLCNTAIVTNWTTSTDFDANVRFISDRNLYGESTARLREKSSFEIVEPLEVLTTNELFILNEEDIINEASEE